MSTKKKERDLLIVYNDPSDSGSLGGVQRFAAVQGIRVKKVDRDLGYTWHKPRRKRFETLPVVA